MSSTQFYWNLQLLLSITRVVLGFRLKHLFSSTFDESVVMVSSRRKIGVIGLFPIVFYKAGMDGDLWVQPINGVIGVYIS